jgi:tRNA(Ile)-lysidine synthase
MNSLDETVKKVKNTLCRYSMIMPGDRVIVAVSGGPDSVCLLDILHELKDDFRLELIVAHFDHGFRPGEDEAETHFVESLAGALNLFFETKRADQNVGEGRASTEEMARNARYQFLEEVQERFFAHKIALGHSLNDQAETVLMRLLRGSGPSGLAGIPPYRDDRIIRPLIEVARSEIERYIERRGLKYMTDSSNLETHYLRNRIRLELIPLLKEYQPRIVELLGQTADIMRKDDQWLETMAEGWVKEKSETKDNGEIHIPVSPFITLPKALRCRVIRHVLRTTGGGLRRVSLRHISAINRMAERERPQSQVSLPNRLIAKRVYDNLVFTTLMEDKGSNEFWYPLYGPGSFHLEAGQCIVSLEELEGVSLADAGASPGIVFLDGDRITYPLVIRSLRPGDRFIPLGMTGHKKLKDFFIDLKIPSEARARIPILTCNNIPIWICGLRIDDRFKVTPDTKKILKATFRRKTPQPLI